MTSIRPTPGGVEEDAPGIVRTPAHPAFGLHPCATVPKTYVALPSAENPIYTITVAETEEDKRATYAMRFETYCTEMQSLPAENYPSRLETDAFDADAVNFIARHRGRPVGSFRIIFPGGGKYLMESGDEGFHIEAWFPRESSCELSRIVGKKITDPVIGDIWQSELLYRAVCQWCVEHGYTHWAFAIREKFFLRLRSLEWPIFPLTNARAYHGITAVPVIVNLEDLWRRLQQT